MMNEERELVPPQESTVKKVAAMLGGGMSKERRGEVYFSRGAKDAVLKTDKTLANIHDIRMSPGQKERLYGIGRGQEQDVGDILESRLGTDSRSGLIREMVEQTQLTRREAEALVERWILVNNLVEVNDPTLGKIIIPRGRR